MMIVIDGENCRLGRLGTFVASELKKGEQVKIINAEKIVITGDPVQIKQNYKALYDIKDISNPRKSPKMSKRPDLFVKRCIRGMVPHRTPKGAAQMRNLIALMGSDYPELKKNAIKAGELTNTNVKTITILEICRYMGWGGKL